MHDRFKSYANFPYQCAYPGTGAGFVKASYTRQQKRIPKHTLSEEAEQVEDSVWQAYLVCMFIILCALQYKFPHAYDITNKNNSQQYFQLLSKFCIVYF